MFRLVAVAANWAGSQPLTSDEMRSVEMRNDEKLKYAMPLVNQRDYSKVGGPRP